MIIRLKLALPAAAVLALAACADAPGPARPVTIPADAVATNVEQCGKFISLVGPMTQHSPPYLGVPGTNYDSLRSLIDTPMLADATLIAVVFITSLIIFSLLTANISERVLDSRVGAIDRTLGFVYGIVRGLILVVIAIPS